MEIPVGFDNRMAIFKIFKTAGLEFKSTKYMVSNENEEEEVFELYDSFSWINQVHVSVKDVERGKVFLSFSVNVKTKIDNFNDFTDFWTIVFEEDVLYFNNTVLLKDKDETRRRFKLLRLMNGGS